MNKKRILVSGLLILTILFTMTTSAFAVNMETLEQEGDELMVTRLAENKILLSDGNETAIMKVEENDTALKVSVINGTENGCFLVDKTENTIYSSYTGKTVSLEDMTSEDGMNLKAAGDIIQRTTYKISYAKLASLCSSGSSKISIASAVITLVAIAAGVNIATAATTVVSLLSGFLSIIVEGLNNKSSSHGVKAVVIKREIRKHQGGRMVKGYVYNIESVGTY